VRLCPYAGGEKALQNDKKTLLAKSKKPTLEKARFGPNDRPKLLLAKDPLGSKRRR